MEFQLFLQLRSNAFSFELYLLEGTKTKLDYCFCYPWKLLAVATNVNVFTFYLGIECHVHTQLPKHRLLECYNQIDVSEATMFQ